MLDGSRGLYGPASCGTTQEEEDHFISNNIYCLGFSGSMRISRQLYFLRIPLNDRFQTLPFQRTCRSPLTVWRWQTDKEIAQHPSTKGDGNGKRTTLMAVAPVAVQAAFQSWKTVCIFSRDGARLRIHSLHQLRCCSCRDGHQSGMLRGREVWTCSACLWDVGLVAVVLL